MKATRLAAAEITALDPYKFMATIGKRGDSSRRQRVDRARAASELTRVTRRGGKVLATEFCWRKPPTGSAREVVLGQVCPGLQFDTLDDWIQLYQAVGSATSAPSPARSR